MMLLSLGGTLAKQATRARDLCFLLSAPTIQITEITHLLKGNKNETQAGNVEMTAAPPGGPSSCAPISSPPLFLLPII